MQSLETPSPVKSDHRKWPSKRLRLGTSEIAIAQYQSPNHCHKETNAIGTIRRAAGSKTKFVALLVPLLITVIPCKPLFQLFLQLLHRPYRSDSVLDAKFFATFLARDDFRIRSLGHIALA